MPTNSSPLNNPPPGTVAVVAPNIKSKTTTTATRVVRGQESPRTQGSGGSPVWMLLQCQGCGEVQNLIFGCGKLPRYHKCVKCGELMPVEAYRQLMYGWPPLVNPISLKAGQHREPEWRR